MCPFESVHHQTQMNLLFYTTEFCSAAFIKKLYTYVQRFDILHNKYNCAYLVWDQSEKTRTCKGIEPSVCRR